MSGVEEQSLPERMLGEPIRSLWTHLASEPRTAVAKQTAVSVMRTLVLEHSTKPHGLRFEVLLMFLLEDRRLTAEHALAILAVIGDDSEWIYGGITVAVHAEGLAAAPWLRERYPKLTSALQSVLRILCSKVNPDLGRALGILE